MVARPGTLVLAGTNSYAGGTFVTSGVLIVNSSVGLPDGNSLIVGANASSIFGGGVATGSTARTPTAIPEPPTIALLTIGATGVLGWRWRKRAA